MLMQAGWSDFFGIFKKKEPAPEPATTTTPSIILSTTPGNFEFTDFMRKWTVECWIFLNTLAVTTTTESNGACWWTQCGKEIYFVLFMRFRM